MASSLKDLQRKAKSFFAQANPFGDTDEVKRGRQNMWTNPANHIRRGIYDLPASAGILARNIPGAVNDLVMRPQQSAQYIRQSANIANKRLPGYNILGNFAANSGQTFGQGLQNMAMSVNRFQKPGGFNKLAGAGQLALGAGQTVAPFTGMFQGLNLATSLPGQTKPQRFSAGVLQGMAQDNTLAPNIKRNESIKFNVLGNKVGIDPIMDVGKMIGFVRNPTNRQLFSLTEKVFPAGNLLAKGTNIKRWLAITGFRGSVEDIFLSLSQLPENATPQDKIKFMAMNGLMGMGSEIVGRGSFDALGSLNKSKGSQLSQQEMVKAYDELRQVYKQWNRPVSKFDPVTKQQVTLPYWKHELDQLNDKIPQIGLTTKNVDSSKLKPKVAQPSSANAGLSDIKKDYPDSTQNPLYDAMMKARTDFLAKTDELLKGKNYKSDAEIPPSILRQLNEAKAEVKRTADEWEKAYVGQPRVVERVNKKVYTTDSQLIGGGEIGANASTPNVLINTNSISPTAKIPRVAQPSIDDAQKLLSPAELKGQVFKGIPVSKPPGTSGSDAAQNILTKVNSKIQKIYTASLDRFHPLSMIAKQAGEDVSMRRALTGHYGTGSTGQYHVEFELKKILNSVDIDELRKAAIALRDAELGKRGIQGSNTTALDDLNRAGQLDPKVNEALQQLYKYQDDLVQKYLVGTGVMSKEAYAGMKAKNQYYVPFKRVMDQVDEYLGFTPQKTGVGSVGSQNIIKKIKGSDKEIHDPIESIIENTYKIVGLGKRQEVATTLVNLRSKLPEGMITEYKGTGTGTHDIVSVFVNGKVKKYKVPIEVAEAAKGMNQEQMNTLVNILAAPTRVFRQTATGLNPEFMMPNVSRDVQSAFVNIGLNPLRFVSGLAHFIKKDDVYQEFLKSGGMTSRISLDRPYLKSTVGELTSNNKGIRVVKSGNILEILAKIGQGSEQPTRIAAFEKTLNQQLNKGVPREQALQDAAYAAQEATVNFARRGSNTQSINMIYAFVNARAQGVDRMIRSFKADPKGVGMRIGMITVAPALGLYAYNRNFQSYEDERIVPKYEKENNFIIMLSDEPIPALGGAQYIKIPKGDIGKMANPVEAFLSFADSKGGDVQEALLSSLKAFSPVTNAGDFIPTALRPAVENAANHNFFQDRPIVSESKLNYPAEFQYNKNTSPIYKELGELFNYSPVKIENLMRGYLTGFARIGEMLVKPFDKENNYSGQDINQTPVARRFLGGAVRSEEEQQLNDYFKQKGILNKVQDIKTGIKYGNIPYEDGINEINKLLETNKETLQTKNQQYLGVAGASASTGSTVDSGLQEEMLKVQVAQSGQPVFDSLGNIIYKNENGNGATLSLQPPTKGQGIDEFSNQNWKYTKAREVWKTDIPQEMKQQAFQTLGVEEEDVRYDYLANHSNDIKTQYIVSKNMDHDQLLERLMTGRVESVSGELFAANGVIDNLEDQGLLTDAEAKALKKMKFDKDGNDLSTPSKGRKPKKVTISRPKAAKVTTIKLRRSKVPAFKFKSPPVKSVSITRNNKKASLKIVTPSQGISYKIITPKQLKGLSHGVKIV